MRHQVAERVLTVCDRVEQDTVIDAGRYDGALGIVTAIGAVKALRVDGKLQQFPRPIEVGCLRRVFVFSMSLACNAPGWLCGTL